MDFSIIISHFFKIFMKIQNMIKALWKINFGAKFLKQRRAPTVLSSKWPLEAASQRGDRAGPPLVQLPDAATAPLLQWLLAVTPSRLQLVLRSIKAESPGLRLSALPHSPFSLPLTLSCSITCKNIFHKAQVQENSVEISQAYHHQAKLAGCSICFH